MGMISDHGGDNYRSRKPSYGQIRTGSTRSVRCDSCGKLSYISVKEFARARIPRCYKCGGRVEETDPGFEKRTGMTKQQAARKIKLGCPGKKPLTCETCGKQFRSLAGLNLHVEDNHKEQRDEKLLEQE